ncbi:hypothetical protein ABVK25_011892 [Lepraria finkii]|uniref:AAA+ ATPase domain-containing protein n=1 Tax=Lepraria finkii TaxID=1340010 RepID=A0ABR4AJK5_9LECA
MDKQVEDKKGALEQQYITLLEQRVAQLQKLVKPLKGEENDLSKSEDEADLTKDKDGASNSPAPLTMDSLAKVADGIAKTHASQTLPTDKVRVRHVVSKFNAKKGSRDEEPIEKANLKEEGAESECILRNVMDESDSKKVSHNEIDLGPGALLDLLREIMADDDSNQTWTGPHVTLSTPFTQLVHKWGRLEEEVKASKPDDSSHRKEARDDLAKVLDFVQRSKGLESFFKARPSNMTSGVITYDHLWTIFPAGTEVISQTFLEDKHVMIVHDSPHKYEREKSQWLVCWYYDHDGTDWVVSQILFEIERYNGTKPIDTLKCYPLEYYKENGRSTDLVKLKGELTERGKSFKRLCTRNPGVQQMFDYKGQLLSVENPFRNQYSNDSTEEQSSYQSSRERKPESNSFKKASVDERIMVDPKSFLEQAPIGEAENVLGEEEVMFAETREKRYDIPEDRKYLIAPPRVLGWSTVRKLWCQFLVNNVHKAREANQTIFEEELQLDADVKKMIGALVTQHNNKQSDGKIVNPDLIEGKGRGLVILLHGPPGVGKTLTAEAISEKTGRPLLIVSVAQIGLNATRAERNLERLFQLASRWEAILLVDEADVFLESRVRESDPNRNALVSVLLRVLEYYQGIMILTTNRIKSLDAAVQSRIHLAVRFDDLNQTQMQNVFSTVLQKYRVEGGNMEDIKYKFKDYLKDNKNLRLNGREIRNVIFSAHAMALHSKKKSMSWDEIREVLAATRDFQDQLKATINAQRVSREAPTGRDT